LFMMQLVVQVIFMSNKEKIQLAIDKLREVQNLINETPLGESDSGMDTLVNIDSVIYDLECDLKEGVA
jgi:hypothetical protein